MTSSSLKMIQRLQVIDITPGCIAVLQRTGVEVIIPGGTPPFFIEGSPIAHCHQARLKKQRQTLLKSL
jgi:hypothetical protein